MESSSRQIGCAASLLILTLLLSCASSYDFAFALPSKQARSDSCDGQIDRTVYSLAGLYAATNGTDQVCADTDGNLYYYRPCSSLAHQQCQTIVDRFPAVCQRDTRKVRQYHDCGSANSTRWLARQEGPETGFIIDFSGGEEGRSARVEFICDRRAGVGTLLVGCPVERPTHHYHLVWRSAYACPVS